jgi:hypothetical protein
MLGPYVKVDTGNHRPKIRASGKALRTVLGHHFQSGRFLFEK